MKSRIQRSMVLILCITLLATYSLLAVVVSNQSFLNLQEEVQQEADYIKAAIDISGEQYLRAMDNVRQKARVTVVRPNGTVTYDSGAEQEKLENHRERKEIKEALRNGKGKRFQKIGHDKGTLNILCDTVGKWKCTSCGENCGQCIADAVECVSVWQESVF